MRGAKLSFGAVMELQHKVGFVEFTLEQIGNCLVFHLANTWKVNDKVRGRLSFCHRSVNRLLTIKFLPTNGFRVSSR